MEQERAFDALCHPETVRVEPDSYAQLAAARRGHLGRIVAQLHARSRVPRVCLYSLSVGGHEPRHSLDATGAFAARQSWKVGAGQSYTDHHGATDPEGRPGWCRVRRQIRGGYADGVVVVTHSVISPRPDEYRRQLDWFQEHSAFVAVVVPEVQEVQR
ncbi:hypothetical protein [Streptomyces sp. SID10853]|uniref:hypothetical protein n=1 Tax=Streptomyces sp. SID10853 TaxID=2706028 RepID=UPI001EF277D4|nr:hypothetical protein [Streptomyces sp. SID10853]